MLRVQRNVERHGETTRVYSQEFSPVTRQVDLGVDRTPFNLRWMSPTAVRARHPDGWIERIAIRDCTCRMQNCVILGATLARTVMANRMHTTSKQKTRIGNLGPVVMEDGR
jgi:hypothetical protein